MNALLNFCINAEEQYMKLRLVATFDIIPFRTKCSRYLSMMSYLPAKFGLLNVDVLNTLHITDKHTFVQYSCN